MAPKLYGIEHILYLVITLSITFVTLFLAKKYLKDEKKQTLFMRIIGLILFGCIAFNRISLVTCKGESIGNLLPTSFCGFTSFFLSLCLIFGKPNLKVFQCIWYLGMFGGLISIFYPDFLGQNISFFYPPTISGLLHHSMLVVAGSAMILFNWFRPNVKEFYYFPMTVAFYIVVGVFEMTVLDTGNAMCIDDPLISGTPLDCWFILFVGTILIFVASYIYNLVVKKKKAN